MSVAVNMPFQAHAAHPLSAVATGIPCRRAICVLGMHRSGTSSLAGAFARMGATTPASLMAAADENERGYYESAALMRFNDEMLADAGSHWADWRSIDAAWMESASVGDFAERAKQTLRAEFADDELIVVKDPRMCRLASFWLHALEQFGVDPLIVTPIRSPLEVAQSIAKRNGLPLGEAVFLWLRHVLDAELATRGRPRTFMYWNDFLADWRSGMARMSSQLRVELPITEEAAAAIDDFLTDSLRHEQRTVQEMARHRDVHPWALRAFHALRSLCDDPDDAAALAELDRVRLIFDRTTSTFSASFGHLRGENSALQTRLQSLQTRLQSLQMRLDENIRDSQAAAASLSAQLGDYHRLTEELGELLRRERAARKKIEKTWVWRLVSGPARLKKSFAKRAAVAQTAA